MISHLRLIEVSELADDPNYAKYRELYENGGLEQLKGRFIAYQNGMVVYRGNEKDNLNTVAEKVSSVVCNDPILIIQIGGGSQYYTK